MEGGRNCQRTALDPFFLQSEHSFSINFTSPETTTFAGPFRHAISTPFSARAIIGATLDSSAKTAAMRASSGKRRDQSAPLGYEPQTIFQAEHACDARRDVLADAVADKSIRFDSPGAPESSQSIFER